MILDKTYFHYLFLQKEFTNKHGVIATQEIQEKYCVEIMDRKYQGDNKMLIWQHANLRYEKALSTIMDYEKRANRKTN